MYKDEEKMTSKYSMKLEAEFRMRALNLPDYVIQSFLVKDKLQCTEKTMINEYIYILIFAV